MPTKPMTPAITAEGARKLAAEFHANPPPIQPHLDLIHDLVREAASRGGTSIEDPFGRVGWMPGVKELEAISDVLVGEGYGVVWRERMPPVLVISWEV
jgi:hypothetical protein